MSTTLVGLFVAACIAGMGYIAYLRRAVGKATIDRQRLRDSFTLIDTDRELKAAEAFVRDMEARRAKAVDDYNKSLWRPSDRPGPERTD